VNASHPELAGCRWNRTEFPAAGVTLEGEDDRHLTRAAMNAMVFTRCDGDRQRTISTFSVDPLGNGEYCPFVFVVLSWDIVGCPSPSSSATDRQAVSAFSAGQDHSDGRAASRQ
jgi:hypothetical protein